MRGGMDSLRDHVCVRAEGRSDGEGGEVGKGGGDLARS
jgi:hypothetical protein